MTTIQTPFGVREPFPYPELVLRLHNRSSREERFLPREIPAPADFLGNASVNEQASSFMRHRARFLRSSAASWTAKTPVPRCHRWIRRRLLRCSRCLATFCILSRRRRLSLTYHFRSQAHASCHRRSALSLPLLLQTTPCARRQSCRRLLLVLFPRPRRTCVSFHTTRSVALTRRELNFLIGRGEDVSFEML